MALAWSLPTGFDTPVTYFYVVYFAVLLIHRQRRDDEKCEKKYVYLFGPPFERRTHLIMQVREGLEEVPGVRSLPHYPLRLLSGYRLFLLR